MVPHEGERAPAPCAGRRHRRENLVRAGGFAASSAYIAALFVAPPGPVRWRDLVLQVLAYLLIAAYAWLRAITDPSCRRRVVPLASWMTVMAVGNLLLNGPEASSPGATSASTFVFLLAYPCALAAVIPVVWGRLRPTGPGQGVEAMVSVLALAAISASFVIGPTVAAVQDHAGTLPVLAFSIFDLLVGTLVVLSIALTGTRAERMSGWLALGLLLYACADWRYALGVATGTWQVGQPVDGVWVLGAMAVGLLATGRPAGTERLGGDGVASFAVSLTAATSALVVLVIGTRTPLPTAGVALAAACILATLLRLLLAYRDMRDLATVTVLATTDELTGLGNRRALHAALDAAADGAAAAPVVLVMVDLDAFKPVNDRCGHEAGDRLLVEVAGCLSRAMPNGSRLARLGGDEFAAVVAGVPLPRVTDAARRFAADVARIEVPGGLRVAASVGVVDARDFPGADRAGLLRRADQAMYEAKRGGRTVVVAEPSTRPRADARVPGPGRNAPSAQAPLPRGRS